jgi:uncharacterized protein YgfB (UPF0149 family)
LAEHDPLAEQLDRVGAAASPSEVHGVIVGMLGAAGCIDEAGLLEVLDLPPGADPAASEPWLDELVAETRERLADPLFRFALVVPSDDRPLTERSASLGEWCSGLLSGVALVGMQDLAQLSPEIQEYLRDVSEIARASDYRVTEGAEEDEAAFAELVEYLRTGAMLMFESLGSRADRAARAS